MINMKQYNNQTLIRLLCGASILCLTGCSPVAPAESTAPASSYESPADTTTSAQEIPDGQDMQPIGGFTLKSKEFSSILNADLLTFAHEASGANLICIKNDDPECAFGVFYNTPSVDETDTNHVFEHAILSGSKKYPSKDIFFDMLNKSYLTDMNASTYDTTTGYYLSSQSQEQLMKMADVYLSCLVDPDILTNKNIFLREALRYQLTDKEDAITMSGTVFSEDFGSLTNITSESRRNISKALYPDMYTSNAIGYLHHNYKDLTYEKTLDTYERCYHFDNSIIMLYGDVDYTPFMEFIDSEYLSKAVRSDTDLSTYQDKEVPDGYEKRTVPSPAYLGDSAENASIITYGIDLSDASWEELIEYDLFSSLLSDENGPLVKRLEKAGIYQNTTNGVNYFSSLPHFVSRLLDAGEEQAELYQECVRDTLKEVADQGFDKELTEALLKSEQIDSYLIRDASGVGFKLFPMIANYWTHTGETDYFIVYERVLGKLKDDTNQSILKGLAAKLLAPERSALVTTVPTPGLAEQYEQEMADYLEEMKASMTEEELDALIADTNAFDAWNELELTNSDFMIEPEALPEIKAFDSYRKEDRDGIVTYAADVDIEHVGSYALYFDSSEIPKEDLPYLALYVELMGNMDTVTYPKDELRTNISNYIFGAYFDNLYPSKGAGTNHHPMVKYGWKGLTEDYETSLELLMEMMENTKFDNADQLISALSGSIEEYDRSRPSRTLEAAIDLAAGVITESYGYSNAIYSQDTYYTLKRILDDLKADPSAINGIAEKLNHIGDLLLQRGTLIFSCAANSKENEKIVSITREHLKNLPLNSEHKLSLSLEKAPDVSAYIVESSNQSSVLIADTDAVPDFSGRYVSFFSAVNDRYLIPVIRFQMAAYGAGGSINLDNGLLLIYSFSDPCVGKTLDVFRGFPDYLDTADITEEDLNGYILSAFASADLPGGIMDKPLYSIELLIRGEDLENIAKQSNEIKSATLADQRSAAEYFRKLLEHSATATIGNGNAIQAEADAFKQVIDYRESR